MTAPHRSTNMTLPSQSFDNAHYHKRHPRSPAAANRPTALTRILAVAAALVFIVLSIMLIRSVTQEPADTEATTAAADLAPHKNLPRENSRQLAAATTEPRVISPPREQPTGEQARSAAQTAALSDTNRHDSPQDTDPARTATAPTAGNTPDPSAHHASLSAQDPAARTQPPITTPGTVASLIARAEDLWASNKPVEARDTLNRALSHPHASGAQQQAARAQISQINDLLVFSPRVVPGDPLARTYEIQGGDILSRIARNESLHTDWRLLLRLNNIADARRIRVGQKLKLLQGPFHAEIHKAAYRIDFYADTQDSAGNRLYVCSRPCGLGEFDSTPVGMFKVRSESKLVNPHWVNPRTGERFDADNPENPIGERWIGLEGTDENTSALLGYGIHGTIDPESIGGQESMGCVRLLPDDVALAYELLVVEKSTVQVLP